MASCLLLPAFFASGFAALLYQTIWQRMLTLFGGADVYSVTIIVSAFMGGLGIGHLAGGHLSDRLSARGRLLSFASAELAVALFACLSPWLFHDVLYERLASMDLSLGATGAILFVTLLWPTFFMGTSLPLLAGAATPRGLRSAAWVARLYGVNTLGAACGSVTTVWALVPLLGFEDTILIGAGLNLASAAGGSLLASMRVHGSSDDGRGAREGDSDGVAPSVSPATLSFPLWVLAYSLSGFIALSLEIVWFRVLGVVLKANSFTFATLLTLFLAGVGGGALVVSRWRPRAPGQWFLLLQAAIPMAAGASMAVFANGVARLPALSRLRRYLADYESLDPSAFFRGPGGEDSLLFLALYVCIPLLLIGLPTLLMGASFSLLQRATQTDSRLLGRRVGWLQAANIAGCTLGAVVTGLVFLRTLGSARTLEVLVGLGGLFLALFVAVRTRGAVGRARREGAAAVAVVVAVAWSCPGSRAFWACLHGTPAYRVLYDEDGSGVSVLADHPPPRVATTVFVNGLGQSRLPYGGGHTRLGMLPVLLHPYPRRVAIIGLGSGDTVFSAGGRQETTRIDCIEIVRPQLETLRRLGRRRIYPGLSALLEDPRVHYAFTDGRRFLARRGARYDIIEADALRPASAYSGNLYSREYFELMRTRLNAGGLGVTWGPTPRVLDTFVSVFPHVLRFDDILVGSDLPVPFDPARIRARLADPFTQAYYRWGGIDADGQLSRVLLPGPVVYGPGTDRAAIDDVNTDLFPKDEYGTPQSSMGYRMPEQ